METLITNIYAAGDVAEKTNKITGEKTWVPLAPAANKEGYVAGNNAASGNTMVFPGIIGTSITKFNELYIGRTGLTEKEATSKGISVKAKLIKHHSKAHYYPGGSEVYVKLVVRNSDDVIIGAQVAGYTEAVAGYLDALSIAIDKSMSIEELFFADLGYMPAVAPVWHPLVTAARVLLKE
jgi:NADPH-dependent 2,4-dienoyl-CoA reductase/sulfur reductase-like enzyme